MFGMEIIHVQHVQKDFVSMKLSVKERAEYYGNGSAMISNSDWTKILTNHLGLEILNKKLLERSSEIALEKWLRPQCAEWKTNAKTS